MDSSWLWGSAAGINILLPEDIPSFGALMMVLDSAVRPSNFPRGCLTGLRSGDCEDHSIWAQFIVDLENSSSMKQEHENKLMKLSTTSHDCTRRTDSLSCHGYGLAVLVTTKQQLNHLHNNREMWSTASQTPNRLATAYDPFLFSSNQWMTCLQYINMSTQ